MIRKATLADLDRMMEIYDCARGIMRASGNMNQWINGYPERSLVEEDILQGVSYVYEEEDHTLYAAFAGIPGDDPTYRKIDGAWLNDAPYIAVHRIGSDGSHHGVMAECMEFAFNLVPNIKIDTHADNVIMRRTLTGLGFSECGTIWCCDGSPRVAFQKTR